MCKDDHQEKIAKFGGRTIKKVMNWHENSSADLEEIGEETQRIQYVDAQHWSIYPYMRSRSSVSKCRESFTIKSACSNTQWSTVYQTLHWSLKDSRNQQRLQRLSEVYNTQVQQIVMNSQKAPQTVEASQQQYTYMNVDVLVIWRQMVQEAEQVPVSCTSARRHCRVTTTGVNDSKGTRVL